MMQGISIGTNMTKQASPKQNFQLLVSTFLTGLGGFSGMLAESFSVPPRLILLAVCITAWGFFWHKIKRIVFDNE